MTRRRVMIGVALIAVGLWVGAWVMPQTATTAQESVPGLDEEALSDKLDEVLVSQEQSLTELEAILEELAIVKIRAMRRRAIPPPRKCE